MQLPCWTRQPLAPMGWEVFFATWWSCWMRRIVFPWQGKAFFTENQIPFWGNFHHQRIESVLACSGIRGCVSKLKGPHTFPGLLFKGFVSLRQALNQRFACVLCCCYGKLKIMINLDWDFPNSTEHFMIPKPTLAIQQ